MLRKWFIGITAVLAVVALVIAGYATHPEWFGQGTGPASAASGKDVGAGVSATGSKVPNRLKAELSPKDDLQPDKSYDTQFPSVLAHTVKLEPSGKLQAPMTLRFTLAQRVPANAQLIALTREDGDKNWESLPAKVEPDGKHATIMVTHLSLFSLRWVKISAKFLVDTAKRLAGNIFHGVTSDLFNKVTAPNCKDRTKAEQNDYQIGTGGKDPLLWCFGMDGKDRVIRVANRQPFPLQLDYSGMTVKSVNSRFGLDMAQLAKGGTLAQLANPGKQYLVLFPLEDATFTINSLDSGESATLRSSFSGYAQSLYQLEFGLRLGAEILSHFGSGISHELMNQPYVKTMGQLSKLLQAKDCLSAVLARDLGKILPTCFTHEQLGRIFGTLGLLIVPIATATELVAYFRSEISALINQFTHGDKMTLTVARRAPFTFVGTWREQTATLIINDNGTATRTWRVFCSFPNGDCTATATMTVEITGNRAILTYTSVHFLDPIGRPYQDTYYESILGDSEVLDYNGTVGLLNRSLRFVNRATRAPEFTPFYCNPTTASAKSLEKCEIKD